LGATYGSMLSAEHNLERYQPLNIAKIRCNTPIRNLYLSGNLYIFVLKLIQVVILAHYRHVRCFCSLLISHVTFTSGQDVFSAGYAGALHGGLLCASSVVDHCLYVDLLLQQKKLKRKVVKKLE